MPLRLLGGVAIRLRAPGELPPALDPRATGTSTSPPRRRLLGRRPGAAPRRGLRAARRVQRAARDASALLFFDDDNGRQVDVFVGTFSMCHKIPLGDRLEVEPATLPLAELLLTKLQIVELNEKDVRDTLALLYGPSGRRARRRRDQPARIAELCAGDWGLWRTITGNLVACRDHVDATSSPTADAASASRELRRAAGRGSSPSRSRADGSCGRRSASASAGTTCPRRLRVGLEAGGRETPRSLLASTPSSAYGSTS